MPAGRDWFIEQRLRFIDWALLNRGSIQRSEIAEAFGVSLSQASNDIAAFEAEHPAAAKYDKSAKRYIPANGRYRAVRGASRGDLIVTIARV